MLQRSTRVGPRASLLILTAIRTRQPSTPTVPARLRSVPALRRCVPGTYAPNFERPRTGLHTPPPTPRAPRSAPFESLCRPRTPCVFPAQTRAVFEVRRALPSTRRNIPSPPRAHLPAPRPTPDSTGGVLDRIRDVLRATLSLPLLFGLAPYDCGRSAVSSNRELYAGAPSGVATTGAAFRARRRENFCCNSSRYV